MIRCPEVSNPPRLDSDTIPFAMWVCRLVLLVWLSPVIVIVFSVGGLILGVTGLSRLALHAANLVVHQGSRGKATAQLLVPGLPARDRSASRSVRTSRVD